jgi:hypothetical protein
MFTFKELNKIFKDAFKRPAWPEIDPNFNAVKENRNKVDMASVKQCESRYEKIMREKGYSENNMLGMAVDGKFEYIPPTIEFDLGPNDILVLTYPKFLTAEQRNILKTKFDGILDKQGRQVMILEGGLTYSVLHRPERTKS